MEQETTTINNLENLKNKLEVMVAGRLRKKDEIIPPLEMGQEGVFLNTTPTPAD